MRRTLLLTLLAGLTGCTSLTSINPGADKIVITKQAAPSACQYLGSLRSDDINGVTYAYASDDDMDKREVIELKNQAQKLGANLIAVTHETESYSKNKEGQPATLNQQFTTGEAYRCPVKILPKQSDFHS
ncbi:MAG: hypothetical protein K0S08_1985 [Gammaproteobacteria bacterium]|jgi:hypothetical protein|nr:hypothetical protein [Gammaproteobacteria bacterium]MCE3238236.1 hypothetical protein [Gammaproteobacteria bacterium]